MYAELHYFMTIRWNSSSQHVRQLALSCILNLRTHSQLAIELHDSLHDSESHTVSYDSTTVYDNMYKYCTPKVLNTQLYLYGSYI